MKRCSKCKIEKDLNEFHNCRSCRLGVKNQCKVCAIETEREYKKRNKEKILEKQKLYRQTEEYKERRKIYEKIYREENVDRIKSYSKEWRENNKEKNKKKKHEYYLNNKEKIKEYKSEWEKDNPHIRPWRRILYRTLDRFGKSKSGSTMDNLGYSADDLKTHLESLFTDGMSWDNYGEWHIDHIKPLSSFDRNTPPSIVNSLSNLQPLWATTREIGGVIYEGNLNKMTKISNQT